MAEPCSLHKDTGLSLIQDVSGANVLVVCSMPISMEFIGLIGGLKLTDFAVG